MKRRKPRELSKPLFGLNADRETRKKWMRQGKRRIRRLERRDAKRTLRSDDDDD